MGDDGDYDEGSEGDYDEGSEGDLCDPTHALPDDALEVNDDEHVR